ncbi:hypothetical protein [Nocardia gamkensis]|uniref:Uncharacterized protein n=1 Tax=Nocardia gamkensis TaxID=352869 RepID=A0A7X6L1W4_9NOCA|nr:hypothetical protein [Nocardia gamkensis]NKY26325.1 hypothetical protein [Nocardia gamkensis]NQE67848.1 hypothetical protein [Nocardia gamkensis]
MIKRSFELARNDAIEALADELEAVNLDSHRERKTPCGPAQHDYGNG